MGYEPQASCRDRPGPGDQARQRRADPHRGSAVGRWDDPLLGRGSKSPGSLSMANADPRAFTTFRQLGANLSEGGCSILRLYLHLHEGNEVAGEPAALHGIRRNRLGRRRQLPSDFHQTGRDRSTERTIWSTVSALVKLGRPSDPWNTVMGEGSLTHCPEQFGIDARPITLLAGR